MSFLWLEISTSSIIVFYPFERIPSIEIAGVSVRLSQLAVLFSLYFLIILILKKDEKLLNFKISKVFFWFLCFFGAILPSLFFAINSRRLLVALIPTTLVFLAAWFISNFILKPHKPAIYLVWVLFFVGIFGLYQFIGDFIGIPPLLTGLEEKYTKLVFGFARIQATALEPLYWGGMLLFPTTYFLLSLASLNLSRKKTILYILGLLVCGVNLVLTLSRGAYLGFFLAFLVILYFSPKVISFRRVSATLFPLVILISALSIQFFGNSNFGELIEVGLNHILNTFSTQQASNAERLSFLDSAFNILPNNALFGVGSGNFGPVSQFNVPLPDGGWLIVNNVYLEIWIENGILALTIFIAFLFWVLFATFPRNIQKNNYSDILYISLFASLVGYLAQWITFSPIFIMPIFIIIGLLVSFRKVKQEQQKLI